MGIVVDLFAGGGGASVGLEAALGRRVDLAINHDAIALAVHKANHPNTRHLEADIWEVRPQEAAGGEPVDVLWASPDCFPAGTLILTPRGLLPIEALCPGDLVLTHKGRWRPVLSVLSKMAETVEVRGHGHYGLITTPSHPFYSKRVTKRFPGRKANGKRPGAIRALVENPYWPAAESMEGKLWATPRAFPEPQIPTCEGGEFSQGFFYFVGRWIGDGSLNKGDVEICCGLEEAEEFAALMSRHPVRRANGETLTHRTVDHGSSKLFVWGNASLAEWLRANFGTGCESKRLPTWCLSMQANWRRALLSGYVDSDGYEGVRTETCSVSRALAIGIRLLAVSLGHAAALYRQDGKPGEIEGRSFEGRDSYRVAWTENLQRDTVFWDTLHLFSPVREVTPGARREVFSLEVAEDESYVADGIIVHNCTHFSVAKGGKPRKQNIRSLAWVVVRWAKAVRPRVIFLENVNEFRTWGPLSKDGQPDKAKMGETFRRWLARLEKLGYHVEYRVLDASLYGAPTRRRRLFLVARCDGQPIQWPEPTHGPGRLPLRTAAECIDWSLPCPSIFERPRPLAEKTLWRIAQGIRRFVLENPRPFIVRMAHGEVAPDGSRRRGHGAHTVDEPLPTVTSSSGGGGYAVAVPSLVEMNHSNAPHGVDEPVGVVTTQHNRFQLVEAALHNRFQLVEAALAPADDQAVLAPSLMNFRFDSPGAPIDEPAPTITAGNGRADRPAGAGHALGLLAPHLVKVNHGGDDPRGEALDAPLTTVTATQRGHALIAPTLIQTSYGEREGQRPRYLDLHQPLGTVMAQGQKHAVVAAHLSRQFGQGVGAPPDEPAPTIMPGGSGKTALVSAFLAKHYGGVVGQQMDLPTGTITTIDHHSPVAATLVKLRGECNGTDLEEPMPTVTAGGFHIAEVRAFLTAYYSTDGTEGKGQSLLEPLRTITTKARLGLVTVEGTEYQIVDIGMRMLEPHELLAAQFGRFAPEYDLSEARTKAAKVRLIGNSVCPEMAEAVARANVQGLDEEVAA